MKRSRSLIRALLWAAVILTAAMIFIFSSESGEDSAETSDALTMAVIRLFDTGYEQREAEEQADIYEFASLVVRKCAHFSEFALLGLFLRWLFASYTDRHRSMAAWGIGTAYAVTDELHQLFVTQRAAMGMDVAVDSLGVMAGVLLAWALMTLAKSARGGDAA